MNTKISRLTRKFARFLLALSEPKELCDSDLEYICWITSLYFRVNSIPGHIAEVGVADGRNTVLFGKLIRQFGDASTRQYIGFDTFDGYIERDLNKNSHLSSSAWKECSRESVMERCKHSDIHTLVDLVEGDATVTVPETLKHYSGKKFQPGLAKFALLYIDCNAYEPALQSMKNFLPYMMPGAVIAIDEKLQGGESSAILDFATSQGFQVVRGGANQVPMLVVLPS